jgi:hypothetical protein
MSSPSKIGYDFMELRIFGLNRYASEPVLLEHLKIEKRIMRAVYLIKRMKFEVIMAVLRKGLL